ncbi:hypothetical protein RN96_07685 [Fusobacterium polymorphum]|uniref:DUF3944 domain-containing protein n=1 Tax=Fusobacterium nucleatum subsp. polymorphum TaxID=76857 RepID=A0A2B7YIB9_FUSNP|nr:DUF3944 domain-containing protein [Fusobacterium polymorphum]PGH20950.1 hypothetical protein RN96_07685 [Fusobacterium polymorphum]
MAYVFDKDLEFLGECSDEQLAKLAEIIIKDDDGKIRRTEEVTKSNEYKRYGKNYSKYWEILVGDFQKFGGNSGANLLRGGKGVQYNEILTDILGSKFSKLSVFEKEKELLKRGLSIILDELEVEKRILIAEYIGFQGVNYNTDTIMNFINKENYKIDFNFKIINIILEQVTTKRVDYALLKNISSFKGTGAKIGLGIGIAVKAGLRSVPLLGPITTLNLALTEAKRVTIPASIVVACLRKILNYEKSNSME